MNYELQDKDKREEGGTTHKCKRAYRQLHERLVVCQGAQQTAYQFRGEAIKGQRRFVKQNVLADRIDTNVDQSHEFLLVVFRLLLLLGRAASVLCSGYVGKEQDV